MIHNFQISDTDLNAIEEILQRYERAVFLGRERMGLMMDLIACHNGPCKLDLAFLAAASDLDFFHDVGGIYRHFNRETGALDDAFWPRTAAKETAAKTRASGA